MNIERMKFASARGARIEVMYSAGWPEKWHVETDPVWSYRRYRRIHSDDEHLQYGPISQALIDWVLYGYDTENHPERDGAEAFMNWWMIEHDIPDPRFAGPGATTSEEWGMFRLLVAEFQADRGL